MSDFSHLPEPWEMSDVDARDAEQAVWDEREARDKRNAHRRKALRENPLDAIAKIHALIKEAEGLISKSRWRIGDAEMRIDFLERAFREKEAVK